ncbi:group I intron-associated PD-(D/E)XK endonuclease [Bosea sp. 2YAB26]|uniref:group I intron-associated PD-(D/E)XK endonuclease n=1 Tax=Bosea sp. 2YAB26 TaxID=3237478 RepID=UPI003F8FC191
MKANASRPTRSLEIGTAGEYLTCADLILLGYRAFPVAQGLPYDIIVDVAGTMLRVAVKSTQRASERPARENSRLCYQFCITRSRRTSDGKTDARPYLSDDVDVVAMCALDLRAVAYCHIRECAQSMHFDPPGSPPPTSKRGVVPGLPRKTFEAYTFARVIAVHRGEVPLLPFKWRAAA